MKLTELFHLEQQEKPAVPEEPMRPQEALSAAFGLLTRNDITVLKTLDECFADTQKFCLAHMDMLDRRGLQYSDEAAPWLRVIAAVGAALEQGYLRELHADCRPEEFTDALKALLVTEKIVFSTDRMRFDPHKNLDAWARQFNEYAGQSGITLCFIDLYGDSRIMGVARMADYAEAAEIAGYAGVTVTSRPD